MPGWRCAMRIEINGVERTLPEGLSVQELLGTRELEPEQAAVELNRVLVPRAKRACPCPRSLGNRSGSPR